MTPDLLSIDLEAELGKLALGRLRNRDQAITALVRSAADGRPTRLSIEVHKTRIRIIHDGRPPGEPVVSALGTLFDEGLDESLRQEALETLESLGMLDLLVAFALGARRVELRLPRPASVQLLMVGRSDGKRIFRTSPAPDARGVELSIQGLDIRPARVLEELSEATRYASFQVELNGRRNDGGLRLGDVLIQRGFEGPGFQAVIGVPRQGLAATMRVLKNGIFEDEAWESPSDGRVFEAVVDLLQAGVESRTVRQAVRDQSRKLYRRLCQRYEELGEADRERARQLLFRLADYGAGADALLGVRCFEEVGGERVDAEALKGAALGRLVRAVAPGQRLERFVLSGRVFVLDSQERGFIEKHLGLRVREPTRRPRRRTGVALLAERIRGAARRFWQGLTGRNALPEAELTPREIAFLKALSPLVVSSKFLNGRVCGPAFCPGRLSGWRILGDGRLLLSREHPLVMQMVAAYKRDRRTMLASLTLLSEGRESIGDLTDALGGPIFSG